MKQKQNIPYSIKKFFKKIFFEIKIYPAKKKFIPGIKKENF